MSLLLTNWNPADGVSGASRVSGAGGRLSLLVLALLALLTCGAVAFPTADVTAAHSLPAGATHSFHPKLLWPTGAKSQVLATYSAPDTPWGPGKRGIELECDLAAPVYAAKEGIVFWVGEVDSVPGISIAHSNATYRTTYQPVIALVSKGQQVRAGQLIGYMQPPPPAEDEPADDASDSGSNPGEPSSAPPPPPLHFGVKLNKHKYVDPLPLLIRGPVRLLPVSSKDSRSTISPGGNNSERTVPSPVLRRVVGLPSRAGPPSKTPLSV